MVEFENREIWADLENRGKVVHSENFPIWRPPSGHRHHVTHHVTSHVTHWGQWKYASRSWHAVDNHCRQLKLMYRSKISGRGPKHCSGSKFQCRPRPDNKNPYSGKTAYLYWSGLQILFRHKYDRLTLVQIPTNFATHARFRWSILLWKLTQVMLNRHWISMAV